MLKLSRYTTHTKHQQSSQNDADDDTNDGNCVDMHDNIMIMLFYTTTVNRTATATAQQQ